MAIESTAITDDVMFQNVMKDPVTCQMLIQSILPKLKIERLEVHTQERVVDDRKHKSVIMDIWAKEMGKDDPARQYDVEMQVADQHHMDLRARYYMSRLDTESLRAGKNYSELPPSYVIFLCPFDPMGTGLREYDFVYRCNQDFALALDTRTEIIYLNSVGDKGEVSTDLQNFFKLMNGETAPRTKFTNKIQFRMDAYSRTPEWRDHRMYIDTLVNEGKKAGKQEGIQEGIKKGKQEGKRESIINTIKAMRGERTADADILNLLKKIYGSDYSSDELKQFMKEN